jgi:addiction module HigA family antidote
MRMHNPPHPGETLREDVLPALGVSVAEAARQLGVSRVALSRVINAKAAISVDLARRLEAWLRKPDGRGPGAEVWLRGQIAYDLWQSEHSGRKIAVTPAADLMAA